MGVAIDRVTPGHDNGYRIVSRDADVTYIGDPNNEPFLQIQTTVGAFETTNATWDGDLLRSVREAALRGGVRIPVRITYVIHDGAAETAVRIVAR
jgi:hypothetical protein